MKVIYLGSSAHWCWFIQLCAFVLTCEGGVDLMLCLRSYFKLDFTKTDKTLPVLPVKIVSMIILIQVVGLNLFLGANNLGLRCPA